jgi:hypothetical protein
VNPEHRKSQRYRLETRVAVFNALSGEKEGMLGNLSNDGLMLIADHPVTEDALFQLSLSLPDGQGGERDIELGAQCLWCDAAASAGTFWAGFKIVDISVDDQRWIRQVLSGATAEA